MDTNKTQRKKLDGNYKRIVCAVLKKILEVTPDKKATWPPASYLTNHSSKKTREALLEKQG